MLLLSVCFVSCSGDEPDPEETAEKNLIGVWNSEAVNILEISVNEEELTAYLRRNDVPDLFISQIQRSIASGATDLFDFDIELKEDGSYTTTDGGVIEDGKWELINDGGSIIFDRGTDRQFQLDITRLTEFTLEGDIFYTLVDDVDSDGVDDEVGIQLQVKLSKE